MADKLKIGAGFCIIFFLAGLEPNAAQSAHKPLRSGDQEYDKERYSEAEKEYRKAVKEEAANPNSSYNLGNSLYMQGKYEDAGPVYEQSLQHIKDPLAQADALHNTGNVYFKQAKYDKSVEAYENSLRLRPGDAETKRNLQMAKKKLKEEQQKEKEKQQQDQQKQDQQDQQQNQQNQQPQQNQQDQQQQQQQNQQPQNNQQKQQPQQPQEQPHETPPGQMSRKDAERLLQTAVGREDQKNDKKYLEQQPAKAKRGEKDW